jgi:hypothetical protein
LKGDASIAKLSKGNLEKLGAKKDRNASNAEIYFTLEGDHK